MHDIRPYRHGHQEGQKPFFMILRKNILLLVLSAEGKSLLKIIEQRTTECGRIKKPGFKATYRTTPYTEHCNEWKCVLIIISKNMHGAIISNDLEYEAAHVRFHSMSFLSLLVPTLQTYLHPFPITSQWTREVRTERRQNSPHPLLLFLISQSVMS